MTVTASWPSLKSGSDLSSYLRQIHRYPILEVGDEYMLGKRWREHADRDAAHKLVTSHLRLVAKIALGYRSYGLPIEDLIAEGNVGMMQAVQRFDPDRGVRLASYAVWWIRAAIQEYVLHSWSLVKMGTTAAQKKLFFNLRRLKGRLHALDSGDLSSENVAKIATELAVPEVEVVSMNQRLSGPDFSLNAPLNAEIGEQWQDQLADESSNQEQTLAASEERSRQSALLRDALSRLNARERDILMSRRLHDAPATLGELAEKYGVSYERARQIEVHALDKLRRTMRPMH